MLMKKMKCQRKGLGLEFMCYDSQFILAIIQIDDFKYHCLLDGLSACLLVCWPISIAIHITPMLAYNALLESYLKKKQGRINGNPVADDWAGGAVMRKPLVIQ